VNPRWRIGNRRIALEFSRARKGALTAVVDRRTGCNLLRDPAAPALLWRLALRRQGTSELTWIDSSQARRVRGALERDGGDTALRLTSSGFPGGLTVTVTVSLAADSAFSRWRIAVAGLGGRRVLHQAVCPIVAGLVKLGDPAPGESLVMPMLGEGYVFRHPYPVRDNLPLSTGPGPEMAEVGLGRVGGRYPGALALQMCAFHNDRAGLYLAAHDAAMHVKEFEMGPWEPDPERPVLRMSYFPGETRDAEVSLPYDAVVGVFHGDWHDAADLYKAWAVRQWWCERKLWDRDIAEWMRRGVGGVFQMSNYHIPKIKLNHSMDRIADVVNDLSTSSGAPLLGLIFNWERGGAWTGPKGFFPPREGAERFRRAMRRLRRAGNYGFVYITGGCWYIANTYDPPFDSSAAFEKEGRPNALKDPAGKAMIESWYPGWKSSRLCPATDYTRDLTVDLFLRCLDLGCTVVQIDNFPCCNSGACHDPAHGHPPGHGPWWSESWGRILAEVRRRAKARDPECAVSTEGICECFIPWLDFFDQRAGNMEFFGHYGRTLPMGGETVPLFSYVYGGYIGAYYAAYPECNRPEVLYWTRGLAKAVSQGVVPTGGRYLPDPPDHNPVTIAFYRKIVRAVARDLWPYMMFGELLRRPAIRVPTITAQYCKFNYVPEKQEHRMDPQQRHEVQDAAVQHGVFRGRDGAIAYFFANVSREVVTFDFALSGFGPRAGVFNVTRVTDGRREAWLRNVRLPRRVRLVMKAFSVTVLIVREVS
jgi:hypothetical protein